MATSATTKFTINAATFMSPGDLAKAQHMVDKEAGKSGEMLMRTAAQSITNSIKRWASANTGSFQSDIDKALQPLLKGLQQQVVKTLGGAHTVLPAAAAHAPASASSPNYSTISQAQWNAMAPPKPYTAPPSRGGGGGGGGGERGGAVGESISMALTMETIHAMVEQIGEVRNEMYDANIQSSNLQRQMFIPIAKGNDVRNFTNAMADPGMALGYTKQQALAAASTLALAGNSRTTEEAASANEGMFKFANRFGLEAPQWANVLAGGETAGLFGLGPGNLGYGGKGVEGYQSRVAGLYGIAAQSNGTPGNRGTGLGIDEFAESINSLSQALGSATGNSEDAAKAFTNLGDKGNVFNMFTALQRTGNQAFNGQAGVNLLMGVNSSIQNQVFGSPMQQAVAYATHPGMNMGQIFAAQSKGLTNPNEFRNQMKFINANYKGDDRELALHQLYGTSYGAGAALEDIYSKNGGKGATQAQLQSASNIMGYGEDSQAKVYRTAMDALTKSMEELAQFISPVVVGFDNLQGATHGLAGIILMTVGALKGKSFLEHLLGGKGEGHHTKGLLGDIKELAEGKGQPVYVTNDCLKVCGQGMDPSNLLNGNAAKTVEGDAAKTVEKNVFGRMFGAAKGGGLRGLTGEIGTILEETGGWKGFASKLWEHGPVMGGMGALKGFGGKLLGQGSAVLRGGIARYIGGDAISSILGDTLGLGGIGEGIASVGGMLASGAGVMGGALSGLGTAALGGLSAVALPAAALIGAPLAAGFAASKVLNVDAFKSFGQLGHILGDSKLRAKFAGSIGSSIGTTFRNIPGIGHMFDFMDSHNDGPVNQESDRHKKELERKRLEHNKATNKEWEKMLGKALDPNNPLSGVVKATMTGDWSGFLKNIWDGASKFFKGFIKNLGDLWNTLFGSKPPGHTTPTHNPNHPSSAAHTGAVSSTSASGSTVTLAPIKLHITVQDSHGHTTTHVMDHHPLKHVATPHKITIGPQHHTQPKR